MSSKYWDDFERRIEETVLALRAGQSPKVRRVAVYVTNRCNFRCGYCNVKFGQEEMSEVTFDSIVKKHGSDAIIHITGGEPGVVPWLYEYLERTPGVRFHLNTNAFVSPPGNVQRLKISLDSHNEQCFDELVHVRGAFKKVVASLQECSKSTVTSITCVLSKQTYTQAPEFMRFIRREIPNLYAVFFSCYKGDNPDFAMSEKDAETFFEKIRPELEAAMDKESLELFRETASEKFRIFGKKRFPENQVGQPCYLSLSERVYNHKGEQFRCSHLFRDNVFGSDSLVHPECMIGCNRRLVKFNEDVAQKLGWE